MSFPLTINKANFTKCAAETMVYIERHKLLEIFTQILAEISISRPANPRRWITENIVRIADEIYKNCIKIYYEKNAECQFYQLPRRFHHRVVIYGRRGSGRRTQAINLAKQFDLVLIDAEVLIEKKLGERDKTALVMQKAFSKDDVKEKSHALCKALSERFFQPDCLQKGWVVINFPNTIEECKELFEKFTVPPNKFVYLDCPEDMAVQRAISKPTLGCPQDTTTHLDFEMAHFKQQECEMNDYLKTRYEVLCVDATPPFEIVRTALLGKLETTPYLMGFKQL